MLTTAINHSKGRPSFTPFHKAGMGSPSSSHNLCKMAMIHLQTWMKWPETVISLGHLCASAATNWYLIYSGNLWYPLTLNPVMLDNLWVLIWRHTGNKPSHSKHHSAVFISEHNNGTTRHCPRSKLLPFRLSKICAILVALEPVSPPHIWLTLSVVT